MKGNSVFRPFLLRRSLNFRPFSSSSSSFTIPLIRNPQTDSSRSENPYPDYARDHPAFADYLSGYPRSFEPPKFGFEAEMEEPPVPPNVVMVNSDEEFEAALNKTEGESKLAVFYFTKKGCVPCRFIGPVMEELARRNPHVTTYKMDTEAKELAGTVKKLDITTVPTVHFFVDGEKKDEVIGSDVARIVLTTRDLKSGLAVGVPPNIVPIKSQQEFEAAFTKTQDESKSAIFYFTAVWCGPCRTIAPIVEKLARQYPHVTTYKVDIDEESLASTLMKLQISSVPTFHFFKEGKKSSEMIGADLTGMVQRMKELYENGLNVHRKGACSLCYYKVWIRDRTSLHSSVSSRLTMAPPSLLGPPEVHVPPPQPQTQIPADPFMDLMVANFNKVNNTNTVLPPMGFTENNSATFLSSGNPCLDFFFHVVPDTPPESLKERLRLAWDHNPLTTLKLICNLRGVRGTGKTDKEGFFTAAFWLHQHHPKTLACNLDSLADFGCFKDLPEMLYRLLEGQEIRKTRKAEWEQRKTRKVGGFKRRSIRPSIYRHHNSQTKSKKKSVLPKEVRILNALERVKIEKEKASVLRKEKKVAMAKKILERYSRDPDFRFLYERTSDVFAECLKEDMESMKSGKLRKIGLAAKWCPSVDSAFDKSTLLCEGIARKIFPRENYPEYESMEEAHYAYQHDKERFSKYLEDVKSGKSSIAAGALLPHEIIESLNDSDGGEVAELQWQRMVNDLLQKGKLRNCMAVCDVSGSMSGTPMEVSVALGVLVSELSEEPWKGKLITFSENPQLQMVQGRNLKEKTDFVRDMEWGANTDFQKVFDLILDVAVKGQLKPEQMIKRLFVFSDMEFDQASGHRSWSYYGYGHGHGRETDYQVIVRKFTEKGYGESIPQIVFWNLRVSKATPVPGTQNGVALVSGFSKNLMKMFLDQDGDINPEAIMEAAISGEEYQKLVVLD
ncbi:Thioredoxin-like protein [Corchorus capsularis]|uniref:Thioredoxin-like protein n=1 Tax=Corchorus capsularis TaxID=210143 RepID=A0A1R3GQS1_COCAP|nr:Thioredoxin-like protein [Corchorus capsularis]